MPIKVTFEHPHFPKDMPFDVMGLGLVPNGGSIEVDEDMERRFVSQNGASVRDALANNEMVKVEGTSTLQTKDYDELMPQDVSDTVELMPTAPEPETSPVVEEGES